MALADLSHGLLTDISSPNLNGAAPEIASPPRSVDQTPMSVNVTVGSGRVDESASMVSAASGVSGDELDKDDEEESADGDDTALVIRERIDTNMRVIRLYFTIRHVVLGETLQMLPHISSSCSCSGTRSAEHLLRKLCMVYLIDVLLLKLFRCIKSGSSVWSTTAALLHFNKMHPHRIRRGSTKQISTFVKHGWASAWTRPAVPAQRLFRQGRALRVVRQGENAHQQERT